MRLVLAGTALAIVCMLTSCTNEPRTLGEYSAWFDDADNGYIKNLNIKNLTFSVQYRPIELMMLNDLVGVQPTASNLDSIKGTYGESEYFLFTVGPGEKFENASGDLIKNYSHDYGSYASIVKDFSFRASDHVQIVVDGDTLTPTLHHYEQGFELGAQQRILFAFQPAAPFDNANVQFIYDDEIFGAGRLKFKFKVDPSELPTLPI